MKLDLTNPIVISLPQTFVLRVFEREEGTRFELRDRAGERKVFTRLEEIGRYLKSQEVARAKEVTYEP